MITFAANFNVGMISRESLLDLKAELNTTYNVKMLDTEFKQKEFSESAAVDSLFRKIIEQKQGEWSKVTAEQIILDWLKAEANAKQPATFDTKLEELIPKSERRKSITRLENTIGFKLNALKPHSTLFGPLVFVFFCTIPFAYAIDWFIGGLAALLCVASLYVLNRYPSQFRYQILSELSEDIRQIHNNSEVVRKATLSDDVKKEIRNKVEQAVARISQKELA